MHLIIIIITRIKYNNKIVLKDLLSITIIKIKKGFKIIKYY